MPDFIAGLKLAELFFQEAVRPVLVREFPNLRYSAALIGPGSEVLGFDTPMSTDHDWGPRAILFLAEADFDQQRKAILEVFRHSLPHSFHGYPTNFTAPDPQSNGTQVLQQTDAGPVNHRVEITSVLRFFHDYLDLDPYANFDVADWLTLPQQRLRTITAGAVFHDDLSLAEIRSRFAWYPRDVWLYLLASEWSFIGQEEPFVGRTGTVGDELGSRTLAARLARHIMRLCFLMERQYAPYSKWFGTAFSKLACAAQMAPVLNRALEVSSWEPREKAIGTACEVLAAMHNAMKITAPLHEEVSPFHGRPFRVIHGGLFAAALRESIRDESVKRINTLIGGVDVFSNSTDFLEATRLRRRLRSLYQ